MNPFHPKVMQSIIVRYMALTAGSSPTSTVVTAVNVFPKGGADRYVGVATGAKLIVAGSVNTRIDYRPANGDKNANYSSEYNSLEQFSF